MDKQVCPLRSPYAVVALSHNLAVVFRHLEEVGNLHATFISVLTFANRDNSIGNFLLSHNEEVRHLLEFALANLVAEFLMPSASAATPRSSQPASGLPRHSACTLLVDSSISVRTPAFTSSFTRVQKSATSLVFFMGVPAHICAVGLYFMGCPVHSVPVQPHKTAPQHHPKESLSLMRMRIFAICRHISDGSIHLELHILNFRSIPHCLLL